MKKSCVNRNPFWFCVLFFTIFWGNYRLLDAQDVAVHIDNEGIYDFLDELADIGVIDINTIVKPYSRREVAGFLMEASSNGSLSERQKKEISFYLRDFGKELTHQRADNKRFDIFYYSDSVFRFTVNPVLGLEVVSAGGNTAYHRYFGGEIHGTIGEHFGFYGSLGDHYESKLMGGEQYLINRRGAVYITDDEDKDYSEALGGITWSWNWGQIGLHKNHYKWGYGYNGTNIFSGNTPSHAFLSLKIKPVSWFELQYMHGWLVSDVVDSLRSFKYYDGTREVLADKYVAANLMTFRPVPRLYVSVGNSIVYADTNVNPAFFVPFLFYKSVDHTYSGASNEVGQNIQMFFAVSSRQIRNLHLYGTLFVDEVSFNRMFDKNRQSNYISLKTGARLTGIPSGFSFTMEYTRTNPMTYQHKIPTTTWETNGYNMGHYLKDNSDELFLSALYRPVRGVKVELSYTKARKGKDYQAILIAGQEDAYPEINKDEPRWGLPFMDKVKWNMQEVTLKGSWQIINDGYVFVDMTYRDISGPDREKYFPSFFLKGDFTGRIGINYGF
jgi:hypothetical protein